MHGDLNLSIFDNFHFELTNIKKYLKEKNKMLMINSLISRNPFKNWITLTIKQILSWLIINPKHRFNMATKKVVSILNEVRKSMLDFCTYHETIFKLTRNYKP